ncbi:hypothetical protein ABND67_21750 [Paenibacillus larvae]
MDTYKEISEKQESAKKTIEEADKRKNDIDKYQKEAEKYEKLAGEKKAELDKVESVIKEKKDAPIVLPAGTFTGGKDIPTGRYKIVKAAKRGSNFSIKTSEGRLKATTIIHGGDHGVAEYVATIDSGDTLECAASFKFTPIE